jgi:hypothetical protein
MESVTIEKYTYFQFGKKLGLPIYVRYRSTEFDPDIGGFLRSMKFEELSAKESDDVAKQLEQKTNDSKMRVLTISEASLPVSRQIASAREGDKYGPESILEKKGYSVYRFKNIAMMVYSLASSEWHMGSFPDFGHVDMELQCRVVMNRFLSWALASHGIIGFWGTPVEGGVVVQRYGDSRGEAILFDIKNRMIMSMDGEKKMRYSFSFIKLDPTLRNRSLEMKFEDLLSFLTVNCTYFGSKGLPASIRQMIQTLCRFSQGHIYPTENFQPRNEVQG